MGGKCHNGYTCQICCVEIIQVLHKTSEWLDKKKKFTFKGRLGRVWRGLLKCLRVPCLLQLKLTFYANEKLVFCYRIKQPKNTRAPLKQLSRWGTENNCTKSRTAGLLAVPPPIVRVAFLAFQKGNLLIQLNLFFSLVSLLQHFALCTHLSEIFETSFTVYYITMIEEYLQALKDFTVRH